MNRHDATEYCREHLNKHGLKDWKVRVTSDPNLPFLGICMYKDKVIMLNGHHIDIHPHAEVICTILHEIAHALVGPGHGHNGVWAAKAREIGCDNTEACSRLDMPAHVIDAIRSGASVEVIVEEKEIVQKIREVKHVVTRLQDKCPDCGKVAVEKFSVTGVDHQGNQIKLITLECFHIVKKIIPRGTAFDSIVSNWWKPEIAACNHKWNKNQCMECGEFRPFKFQVDGALFAESALAMGKGVGIFDEMGLGKTIQALMVLYFYGMGKHGKKKFKKTMVVTKSAIMYQWFAAGINWLGPEYLSQIIRTSKDFLIPNLNMYIISYDMLRRFKREKLHALGIDLVILDEVQQIKNVDSARTQEVRKLVSANPLCKVIELSGTPWKNRGNEFFPALNLLDPMKFHSNQHFLDTWVDYYWHGNKRKMGGIKNVEKFKKYVENIIIRREYDEVMEEYPEVKRDKLPVELDALSQTNYDDATSSFVEWWNNIVIGGEEEQTSGMEIIAKLTRMRHICGLAKIPATLSYLEDWVEESDKKIVVFVHHRDVGVLMKNALTDTNAESNVDWHELASALKEEGIEVMTYTSQHTGKPEGTDIQNKFNATKRCILIASTLACGEGLNLQTCDTAIFHERQWNPQNEDQAAPGRFKRIGQTSKQITVIAPEAAGTTDEYLDAMVDRKRRYFHVVHNKGEIITWSQDDAMRELANTICKKFAEKMKAQGKAPIKVSQLATFK